MTRLSTWVIAREAWRRGYCRDALKLIGLATLATFLGVLAEIVPGITLILVIGIAVGVKECNRA